MKTVHATLLSFMLVMLLANPVYAAPVPVTGGISSHSSSLGFLPSAQPSIPSISLPVRIAGDYSLPVFTVVSVVTDQNVTIQTMDLSPNDHLSVLMANYGTQGIGGIEVGTIDSGSGGVHTATFNIPSPLQGSYQIAIRLESTTSGLAYPESFFNNTNGVLSPGGASAAASTSTFFSVVSVVRNTSVTLQIYQAPANDAFDVFMGDVKVQGMNETKAGTIFTGNGGQLYQTIPIPANLHGVYQISLRLESPYSGYYSYQLFNNTTTYGYGTYYPNIPYGIVPTITIISVAQDSTVTFQTANFPPNDTFYVRMGPIGTAGINGTYVGTLNSGSGGSFQATVAIPNNLKGSYQIAIRLESPYSDYYSYNWFYNNTVSNYPYPYPNPYPGLTPTFSIVSVVKDSTVTIQTANFPPNDTFNVRMGPIGTAGINGTYVGSVNSGSGGVFQATFNVPGNLVGSYQIAIRLESPTSGYYAYNWFYNNTANSNPVPSPVIIPTFTITSVVQNSSVTIQTANFPANDTFNVRMGPMGTAGINGTVVGTISSGSGGSFTATFNVPANLVGSYQIAIRLESPTSGYYSYNWFYNNNAP